MRPQLSPVKTRATPLHSRSPARSPRKSPTKHLYENVRNVSFTPQRTKQPPRAWERRPATPYVPRDDKVKQKIWKRVPLGELGVDSNQPTGIASSRREAERTKDYVRVVKKLKVGHDEDKENTAALASKVSSDEGSGGMKRVQEQQNNFVNMRVEEDEILGSPKKKLRTVHAHEVCAVAESAESEDHGGMDSEYVAQVEVDESEGDEGMVDTCADEGTIDPEEHDPLAQGSDVAGKDVSHSDGRLQSEHEQMIEDYRRGDSEKIPPPKSESLKASIEEVTSAAWAESMSPLEREAATDSLENIQNEEQQLREGLADGNVAEATYEEHEDHDSLEDNRSSSPPTILAENVTIDELAARDLPKAHGLSEALETQVSPSRAGRGEHDFLERQGTVPRRISDDDASFLRGFMSRTKAAKAAREQALQDTIQEDVNEAVQAQQEEHLLPREDFAAAPPKLDPLTKQTEQGPISPLRRSKRAVVTSIPRPQSIANTIQLKRANGNEFIFTANKASSTAHVAMVTRSNTKKNKGSALNVPARLEQILVEKAKEEDGQVEQNDEIEKMTVENNSAGEKVNNKRKHGGKDHSTRAKKVLRWNDDNLVSYQEAEQHPDGWENIEDSSQESIKEKPEEPTKVVKLTLTVPPIYEEKDNALSRHGEPEAENRTHDGLAVKEHKDTSTQTKVRRVRRGIAGTVNGTPAPKTRSRRIFDDDETTVDLAAEETSAGNDSTVVRAAMSAAATDHITEAPSAMVPTTTARKSRMPVPSAQQQSVTASARVKNVVASATAGSAQALKAAVTGNKKPAKLGSNNEKDKQKGDTLGPRRLRVRP